MQAALGVIYFLLSVAMYYLILRILIYAKEL